MNGRLRTHQKDTRIPAQELSTAPTQGMFQPRPFEKPAPAADSYQQLDLKTSLMRAERYGHHLGQMHDSDVSAPQVAQPKMGRGRSMQSEPAQLSSQPMQPSSGGRPLPKNVRQKMEAAFSTDFSNVSVHQGTQAKSIGAEAYTQGSQIHFQPGKYNPTSQSGQQLLGHELTHVVQQRAGQVAVPQGKGTPINSDSKLEQEADILGAKAAQGDQVQVAGAGLGIQRQATSQLGHSSAPVQLRRGRAGNKRPAASQRPTSQEPANPRPTGQPRKGKRQQDGKGKGAGGGKGLRQQHGKCFSEKFLKDHVVHSEAEAKEVAKRRAGSVPRSTSLTPGGLQTITKQVKEWQRQKKGVEQQDLTTDAKIEYYEFEYNNKGEPKKPKQRARKLTCAMQKGVVHHLAGMGV